MKNLFFEVFSKAKQERRKSSARSAHPLLKIASMTFLLLMVSVNVWGSITVNQSLTGCTYTGSITTIADDTPYDENLVFTYTINDGYSGDDISITIASGSQNLSSSYFPTYWGTWEGSGSNYTLTLYSDYWCKNGRECKWGSFINITIGAGQTGVPTYTVSFDAGANNVLVAGSSGISGDGTQNGSITTSSMSVLPTATPCDAAAAEGWVFDGWRAGSAISGEADSYTNVTTPYNPSSNITLYAVYKKG